MIPSDTRLRLIDQATDQLGGSVSPASLCLFVRHLRRGDLDVSDWHRCDDIAKTGALTHHQARAVAHQLVTAGLLDRRVVPRRRRGDKQHVEYRLNLPQKQGVSQ
ncbi:hypothetical protein ACFC07_22105 [Streptomyces sp. NPDC056099]|uniref:hypothetical protein n=1 Tax=unclassified Streptomyces TaxID=2593676 RepID=UPI0035D70174